MMGKDGVWHLAPAYDMTFAINLKNRFFGDRHAMAIYGKRNGITMADLLEFARRNDIPEAKGIIEKTLDAVGHFSAFAEKAGVPDNITGIINASLTPWLFGN